MGRNPFSANGVELKFTLCKVDAGMDRSPFPLFAGRRNLCFGIHQDYSEHFHSLIVASFLVLRMPINDN